MTTDAPSVLETTEPALPRVYLIAVQSLDGFITRGERPGSGFASQADQVWFRGALAQMDAVIMGAGTYLASRERIRAHLTAERPRYICTRNPAQYSADAVADSLFFTRANPADLVASIAHSGHRQIALVGGGETHARFLAAGCVDELWITIEPLLFGNGTPLAPGGPDLPLRFLSHEFLSPETLVLKYEVGSET